MELEIHTLTHRKMEKKAIVPKDIDHKCVFLNFRGIFSGDSLVIQKFTFHMPMSSDVGQYVNQLSIGFTEIPNGGTAKVLHTNKPNPTK